MDPTMVNEVVNEVIGSELRAWRGKRGISRLELSRMTGIGHRSILRYEEGEREASAAQVVLICTALDVPLVTFYGRVSDELAAASQSPRSAADIAASFGI
ncbi:helix-turn-helix transcriptional regulator [Skermania sp. ID1734]|nr:helix-turn-helix transcriptional regulator [Skermania sp. ID1734]